MRGAPSRRAIALLIALLVLLPGAVPASARPTAQSDQLVAVAEAGRVALTRSACSDGAYTLHGARWAGTLKWWFRQSSTPTQYNAAAVWSVLQQSFANVTGARNDCGRGDSVSATVSYEGTTDRKPCGVSDGYNVVGFGRLALDTLAVTCWWYSGDEMVEADIKINSRVLWALAKSQCSGRELLEPAMTHEVGHAFGLGHVGESRHGKLTMSTQSNGSCHDEESTLGLGDMLGLEALY